MARKKLPPNTTPEEAAPADDLVIRGKRRKRSPREQNRVATVEAKQLAAQRASGEVTESLPKPPTLLQVLATEAHFVPYDPALTSTAGEYAHKGKPGRPPAESSQAAYAFALYAALPPGERSYQAVLDILVKEGRNSPNSLPLIARWGGRWNWNERAKLHDAQIIEESRKRWEIERISMHQEIATSSAAVYNEVVKLLEERAREGRLGNDAAVQLLRVAADLRHRSYQELTASQKDERKRGIEITIETRSSDADAQKRFATANPQVLELKIPLRDPDEADGNTYGTLGIANVVKNDPRRGRLMAPHIIEDDPNVIDAESAATEEEDEDDAEDA